MAHLSFRSRCAGGQPAFGPSLVLIVLGIALCTAGRPLRAAEPAPADLLQAHLEAGEFGPARQLAEQAVNGDQRDQRLGQIAVAQARAGQRQGAIASASEIRSDLARASTLGNLEASAPAAMARGGGAEADFDSLIDLIKSTVAPTTWDDVGGPGAIQPFPTGVYVDSEGVLQRKLDRQPAAGLARLRLAALEKREQADVRHRSALRKVSLTRLEKHVQLLHAAGRRPTDEMQRLAGLQKIRYVLIYPESGDIVLAGPAGDWKTDDEGRSVSRETGRPVLALDDLVVLLRHITGSTDARFGCAITPTEEALAQTKAFLDDSSRRPLKPGKRNAWLKELRSKLGQQVITIDGIDPRTRVAQVLVEADYRMKLVGMGLEEGTLGVTSYLELVQVPAGQAPPPMDVLRWWFTMNYDAIRTTEDRNAFELRGQGVQVLSENELLTALGQRIHTGKSQPLNQEFAQSFTEHFGRLAEKYPIYAELQNVFDLALVAALIKSEKLTDQVDWHMTWFGPDAGYQVALGPAPTRVETVINHRMINDKYILAGVSGGVHADPRKFVERAAIEVDKYGVIRAEHRSAAPAELPADAWWWD